MPAKYLRAPYRKEPTSNSESVTDTHTPTSKVDETILQYLSHVPPNQPGGPATLPYLIGESEGKPDYFLLPGEMAKAVVDPLWAHLTTIQPPSGRRGIQLRDLGLTVPRTMPPHQLRQAGRELAQRVATVPGHGLFLALDLPHRNADHLHFHGLALTLSPMTTIIEPWLDLTKGALDAQFGPEVFFSGWRYKWNEQNHELAEALHERVSYAFKLAPRVPALLLASCVIASGPFEKVWNCALADIEQWSSPSRKRGCTKDALNRATRVCAECGKPLRVDKKIHCMTCSDFCRMRLWRQRKKACRKRNLVCCDAD